MSGENSDCWKTKNCAPFRARPRVGGRSRIDLACSELAQGAVATEVQLRTRDATACPCSCHAAGVLGDQLVVETRQPPRILSAPTAARSAPPDPAEPPDRARFHPSAHACGCGDRGSCSTPARHPDAPSSPHPRRPESHARRRHHAFPARLLRRPRRPRRQDRRHPLAVVLALAAGATLCGARG